MQRYKIEIGVEDKVVHIVMEDLFIDVIEDPKGEWVRYYDVETEIERIRRSYEHRMLGLKDKITALEGVYSGKWTYFTPKETSHLEAEVRKLRIEINSLQQVMRISGTTTKGFKCNCAKMLKLARIKADTWPIDAKRLSPHWLCPAHGYKRL